jgi:hypothetical protein
LLLRNAPFLPKSEKKCYNDDCDKPGTAHCSRCKSVWYCGRECQAEHYKGRHKKDCGLHFPASEWEYVSTGQYREYRKYKKVHGNLVGEVAVEKLSGRNE